MITPHITDPRRRVDLILADRSGGSLQLTPFLAAAHEGRQEAAFLAIAYVPAARTVRLVPSPPATPVRTRTRSP